MEITPIYNIQILKHLQFLAQTKNLHVQDVLDILKFFNSKYGSLKVVKQNPYGSYGEINTKIGADRMENVSYQFSRKNEQNSLQFRALTQYCNQNIPLIFSKIAKYVLTTQKLMPKMRINQANNTFEKSQIAYIMCLMALNLIDSSKYSYKIVHNKVYNFSHIFSEEFIKVKTIIDYFNQLFTNIQSYKKLQIRRESVPIPQKMDKFIENSIIKNMGLPIQTIFDKTSIDQYDGYPKIDFANKYIGGGALSRGLLQEQNLFVTHPELYSTTILCSPIKQNQALIFTGFTKLQNQKEQECIIAIDAQNYCLNQMDQFTQSNINRQILKAFVGFKSAKGSKQIITGNWGCGAYKGNIRLKYMIQWISSSLAEKQLIYCSYGTRIQDIVLPSDLFNSTKHSKIIDVYKKLINAAKLIKGPYDNIYLLMYDDKNTNNFKKHLNTYDNRLNQQHRIEGFYKQKNNNYFQRRNIMIPNSYQQSSNNNYNNSKRGCSVNLYTKKSQHPNNASKHYLEQNFKNKSIFSNNTNPINTVNRNSHFNNKSIYNRR